MDINDLSILSDNQINYSSLSEEILAKLVFGDDLFVATSALSELSKRKSRRTGTLANEILLKKHGDRYLQAEALETLFNYDKEVAMNYIEKTIDCCDSYVFNSILELMIENPDFFKLEKRLVVIQSAFKRIHDSIEENKWPEQDVAEAFASEYSGAEKER